MPSNAREELWRKMARTDSAHASQYREIGEWVCACGFVGSIHEQTEHHWSKVLDALLARRELLLEALGGERLTYQGFQPDDDLWRFPVVSGEQEDNR